MTLHAGETWPVIMADAIWEQRGPVFQVVIDAFVDVSKKLVDGQTIDPITIRLSAGGMRFQLDAYLCSLSHICDGTRTEMSVQPTGPIKMWFA